MNLEIKFKCNGKRLLPRPKNALMHPPAVPPHPPVAGASIGVRCRYSTPLRATESWSLGKIRIISIYISTGRRASQPGGSPQRTGHAAKVKIDKSTGTFSG